MQIEFKLEEAKIKLKAEHMKVETLSKLYHIQQKGTTGWWTFQKAVYQGFDQV